MIISQALARATKKIKESNIKNPHLEAELLLSSILKKKREYILTHGNDKLNFLQITNYKLKVVRRAGGLPLAYLTHSKGFYGRDFYVNKNVLVPRPETEIMIEQVTNNVKRITNNNDAHFIDVGTGSGCIIISLIKELQEKSLFDIRYSFHAVDISKNALKVAKKNAKTHGVSKLINFYQGNLLEPILNNPLLATGYSLLTITANLPYLSPSQVKHSPTIQKEPKIALEAGFDGLKYYRELLSQVAELRIPVKSLRSHGASKNITCYLEIDDSQKDSIQRLIKEKLPNAKYKIKTDLRGESRLVIIEI